MKLRFGSILLYIVAAMFAITALGVAFERIGKKETWRALAGDLFILLGLLLCFALFCGLGSLAWDEAKKELPHAPH